MTIELKMPALSPTMESGTLAKWLVKLGDAVKPGDILAEIETDKATMEFESADEGWVETLAVGDGTDDIPVGTVIALLRTEAGGSVAAEPEVSATSSAPSEPRRETRPEEAQPDPEDPVPPTSAMREADMGDTEATALAARIAKARGSDLRAHAQAGRKVQLQDLVTLIPQPETAHGERPSFPAPTVEQRPAITPPPTDLRIVASAEIRVDRLQALVEELNLALAGRGITITTDHFAIKAMAASLSEVAAEGLTVDGDGAASRDRDVAIAASRDGATPVIRNAGASSLSAIATAVKRFAQAVQDGSLEADACRHDVPLISTLDVDHVAAGAVPQRIVVTTGAVRHRARDVEGQIALVPIMTVTATFPKDGNGTVATAFLKRFTHNIEHPFDLLT